MGQAMDKFDELLDKIEVLKVQLEQARRQRDAYKAALYECAAPFMSRPHTIGDEFHRRMNVAATAIKQS